MNLADWTWQRFLPHLEQSPMSTEPAAPKREWPPLEPGKPVPGAKEWLDEHWGEYPGEWVAVRDGQLLGHAFKLEELERQLGGSLKIALVTKMV
jgi:hypothetical protein